MNRRLIAGLFLALGLHAAPALAQELVTADSLRAIVVPGSPLEDRLRAERVARGEIAGNPLLRSASAALREVPVDADVITVSALAPRLTIVRNSDLPHTFNDGALWAGRGLNVHLIGGARIEYGPVRLTLAPEYIHSQNRGYQYLPYSAFAETPRQRYAARYYGPPESIDMPTRFGDRSITSVRPGQSSLEVDAGPVRVGASTENLWWGAGARNGIILSSHAEGIPHFYVATARPLETRVGEFEARWMAGSLAESDYFDFASGNDSRGLGALAVTWRPSFEPALHLGIARVVQRDEVPTLLVPALFDVFRSVPPPEARGDSIQPGSADQLTSFFAHWAFAAGFEAYLEWSRFEQPLSLRDLLVSPNHAQGYTIGLQWARELTPATARLQAEITYLEPSATFKQRPVLSAYTSHSIPQGYTHRGQVLGAAIGPGASSQWIAGDLFAERWSAGAYLTRIRWNEGVLPRVDLPDILRHEISTIVGVRGGVRIFGVDVHAEYALEGRLNWQFQNPVIGLEDPEGIDVRNHSLKLIVAPF